MFSDVANRRYTIQTVLCFVAYMALSSLAAAGDIEGMPQAGRWALSLAVAAPVAAHVWATLNLIRSADEYARQMALKGFVLAWGVTVTILSAWGILETHGEAPHAPGWIVYPLFWVLFFVTSPFVRTTR